MRTFMLLMCLVVGCLAQAPHTCRSPPLLTGALSVANEKFYANAKYTYDAMLKRIRFKEVGSYENKTFGIDALLLFREGVMYTINHRNKTCKKERLKREDFHPMEIPSDAALLGQVILGSSSGPGQGLLVNTWYGEVATPSGKDKWVSTFTEFGCIPVSSAYYTDKTGWMLSSFFNIVVGILDPREFFPPKFCQGALLDETEEAANFYSIFKNLTKYS
ncbi:ependymin isoform X1 [Oncorhynchus tshawytscha]|uniref:Ependymin n=1 Tax=Oncorhynchus tshawytscha TaxID=74940 RepID=A0A8C8LNI6_ONCTS|nr:ependymin isoform X1 [Oncorhynchus tshawytscha]